MIVDVLSGFDKLIRVVFLLNIRISIIKIQINALKGHSAVQD